MLRQDRAEPSDARSRATSTRITGINPFTSTTASRRRLLEAIAEVLAESCYVDTAVGEIVRVARASRQHFPTRTQPKNISTAIAETAHHLGYRLHGQWPFQITYQRRIRPEINGVTPDAKSHDLEEA